MGEYQTVSSKVSLKTQGTNMEPSFNKKPEYQCSGDKLPLKETPMSGYEGFKGGEFQVSGDKLTLSKTPSKGVAGTSNSDRTGVKKGY